MFNRPWLTQAGIEKATSPQVGMALTFARIGYRIYEGTVPAHKVADRRRRNKAARIARRSHR